METGSVLTVPTSGTSHPLNETLQKALETLKIHQQWISNRKSPASVMPEQTEMRFPKRDAWKAQDEAPVDATDTSPTSKHAQSKFPPMKRKSAGLFSSSLTSGRIHPGVASSSGSANMEKNTPLQPPKAAVNAWSGPDITSEETIVDIEEDKSPAAVEKLSLEIGNDRKRKKRKKKPPPSTQSNDTLEDTNMEGATKLQDSVTTNANSEVLHEINLPSEDIVVSQHKDDGNVSTDSAPILNDSIQPEADTQDGDTEREQMETDCDSHVVAVSPAPLPQQISLSSSSQSKLRISETEAHRLENNTAVAANSRHQRSNVTEIPIHQDHSADTSRKAKIVTDSVMHIVMPQQQNEQGQAAVTYLNKKSVTINSSVVSKMDSDGVEIMQDSVEGANDTDSSSVVEDDEMATEDIAAVSPDKVLDLPKLTDLNDMVRQLPSIVDKSSSAGHVSMVDDRCSHDPPPYLLHKKNVVLPPPCPKYGVKQPSVPMTPVSHTPIKRHFRDSPAPVMVKEPAEILSVKPITPVNEDAPSVTSPQTTSSDDSRTATAEDEPDHSSQPLPPDVSQYFVSTTGNKRKQELPALHKAASFGKIHTIQHLLNHGADVNETDADGKTALMYCIHPKGIHLASADLLMKEGTNLDHQSDDGSSVLHLAAYQGAVSLVELLLLNGAQADVRDKDDRLPIHWATHPSSTKCINTILKKSLYGVDDVDKANMTCLMWACFHNNANITAFLLDKHADKEEKDIDGMTAMHWAVHADNVKCLRLLLSPDMTYFKDKLGRTVMHAAAEKGSCKACELILNLRLDAVYDTDKKGRTPLHWAAVYSRVDTCALLLDRGADASQRDNYGKSSLDYAREKGHDYVVAMLTSHDTSQSDFARVSRSASLSTLRSRVPSFGELPSSLLAHSASHLSDDNDGEEDTASVASPSVVSEESSEGDNILVEKGCYLGLFTKYGKGPVEHHFFRLDKQKKVLLHSRDDNATPKQIEELKLLSVQPSPSLTIRNRLDYAPLDLHKYAFCIITTNTGPLDVLAYTSRAYNGWLRELTKLCQQQEVSTEEHSYIGESLDNFSTISGLTTSSGADGWTENSFVRNPLGNSPTASNSHFFSSGRKSTVKTASKHKPHIHRTIEEEPIDDGSTVISNPTVFTSTPQNKPQPDHLPSTNNNDDIV